MISRRYFYVYRQQEGRLNKALICREGWYLFGFIPLYLRDA